MGRDRRSSISRRASPAGSQRISACRPGWAGLPHRQHPPTVGGRAHQGGGVGPAAHRLLGGAQVGAPEQQPGVEQEHGGVAAPGHRLGARRGDDDRGLVVDLGDHALARRRLAHGDPGERPPDLLGRARVTEHGRAQAASAALGAGPARGHGGAPGALGRTRRARGAAAARGRPSTWPAYGRSRRPAASRSPRGAPARAPGRCWTASRSRTWASLGSRAERAAASRCRSRSESPVRPTEMRSRTTSRVAATSVAQPVRTRYSASTLRACAASTAAQPVSWARMRRTSRAWGYGARGSSWRSSPSSQIATSPRSCTGANAAARVPMTTRTAPRAMARNAR